MPENTPCVGCGYCCRVAPCGYAYSNSLVPEDLGLNDIWDCPMLKWDAEQNRHICKATVGDTLEAEKARQMLSIGDGCCSPLCNTWRKDIRERDPKVIC